MLGSEDRLIVCIPVFDDWASVKRLLVELDRSARNWPCKADVLLVDDASNTPVPEELAQNLEIIQNVEILALRRNLGHQRAIAMGLAFLQDQRDFSAVVVMDGDGVDSPSDVLSLIREFDSHEGKCVVFAKRARRAESILFKILYRVYKIVHLVLTGRKVEVGNFSILGSDHINRLVAVSETWNHYAAAIYKSKMPTAMTPIDRATRYEGQSKMNFISLIIHGISAVSVYADEVGASLLSGGFLSTFLAALVLVFLAPEWFPDHSLSMGLVVVIALLLAIAMEGLLILVTFFLITLQGRSGYGFLPIRDYKDFVWKVWKIHESK